ncbi:MAG: type II toxin-antitoxin system RelE/ParE family toxin [Candidatus Margulisiibacteriota bacterium]
MFKYHLEITSGAEKELKKYPSKLQDRIIKKILNLEENPRPYGFKKLFGSNNFRVRMGDYRIIYAIDDARRTAKIIDLGHRKDIYR